jgi:hypothetical protein
MEVWGNGGHIFSIDPSVFPEQCPTSVSQPCVGRGFEKGLDLLGGLDWQLAPCSIVVSLLQPKSSGLECIPGEF